MSKDILRGVVLEESALTIDELAQACRVERRWVVERVEAGLLGGASTTTTTTTTTVSAELRFSSPELMRARRLLSIERGFDANPELAAFAVDLIEEVDRLRRQLGLPRKL
jgi:chaperone modulatory protein CbpM